MGSIIGWIIDDRFSVFEKPLLGIVFAIMNIMVGIKTYSNWIKFFCERIIKKEYTCEFVSVLSSVTSLIVSYTYSYETLIGAINFTTSSSETIYIQMFLPLLYFVSLLIVEVSLAFIAWIVVCILNYKKA